MSKFVIFLRGREKPLIFIYDNPAEAREAAERFDFEFCNTSNADSILVSDGIRTVGFAKCHVEFFELPNDDDEDEEGDDRADGDHQGADGDPKASGLDQAIADIVSSKTRS